MPKRRKAAAFPQPSRRSLFESTTEPAAVTTEVTLADREDAPAQVEEPAPATAEEMYEEAVSQLETIAQLDTIVITSRSPIAVTVEAEPPAQEPPPAVQAGQDAPPLQVEEKTPTSMDTLALVFLDDPIARRLAVAWKACRGDHATWFDSAGLTYAQQGVAARLAKTLRLHGICRDGGVTDPMALQYIQAVIAKPLMAAAKKKPGGQ